MQSSFTRILSQSASGFDEPAELVIRDQAALETAWSRVFNQVQGNPAPAIDFTREVVVLVALGRRTSAGHSVHIDRITHLGDGATVGYTAIKPGEGCMTAQSLTSPLEVVRTSRVAGTVRFSRREATQPC